MPSNLSSAIPGDEPNGRRSFKELQEGIGLRQMSLLPPSAQKSPVKEGWKVAEVLMFPSAKCQSVSIFSNSPRGVNGSPLLPGTPDSGKGTSKNTFAKLLSPMDP